MHLAKHLHHIAMHSNARGVAHLRNNLYRLDHAGLVIRHHYRQQRLLPRLGRHSGKTGRQMIQIDTAVTVDMHQRRIGHGVQHRIMLDRGGDHVIKAGQHQIIRLGTAAGKNNVRRAAPGQNGDFRARIFNNQSRRPPKTVNRRRV